MKIQSKVRHSPEDNGPFWVVTEKGGAVYNITTGFNTIEEAIDQAQADQLAAREGNFHSTQIITLTDA